MSAMSKGDQVNAVALSMQTVMGGLDEFYTALVGAGQHNVILVVGAGDESQYISNVDREFAKKTLGDLLARWTVGLPDTLPGEASSGDTRQFEYLLNEHLAQAAGKTEHVDTSRAELVAYVGRLAAQVNRKPS